MNDFVVDGVTATPSTSDGFAYALIPGTPQPERTSNGAPTLLFVQTGSSSILQAGTRWDIPSTTIDQLRATIAADRKIDPGTLQLGWAAIVVDGVSLDLTPPNGTPTPLASSSSAQYPPFAAIFGVTLTQDESQLVRAALDGRCGILTVTYRATVRAPALSTPVTRSTDIATWYHEIRSQTCSIG